ncbi:transporter (plasmid) [Pacificitalea manganoxidans]|uniref:Transporter n=1 Tax=Pacificitalea manganoxidans TaxID=1411902 RepID=A0A291M4U4_9RHOB|nr:TRAP transporter substrate-binding protein [Pacificitalea manganoxidans]ATI44003.1 transporter [Pacificitalea manganoxidans]MDR6310303.1 tripartite ATP-independent transporter DctP family solute receptor [Pacificitalea manganoxidans]
MKKLAIAAALLTTTALAAQADEIRYATWAQPGEAPYAGAEKFKEVVEANSDHTVTIFPGDQLGKPKEVYSQMALGSTQILASGDPGLKEIEYLALPYLMSDIAKYKEVLDTDFGQEWNQRLVDEHMVRLLGFMPRSPRQISANKVINTIDDLKGLKLRAPERDYYVKSLSALGANPTPMAFAEVYTALQTGIVDGQENPIETIYAQKFHEVQDGVAMVDYIVKPAYVTISESFWQGLSEDDRALMTRANDESTKVIEAALPQEQETILAEMEAAGVTVTYPDKAPFIEATQSVRDELGTAIWGDEIYTQIVEIGGN